MPRSLHQTLGCARGFEAWDRLCAAEARRCPYPFAPALTELVVDVCEQVHIESSAHAGSELAAPPAVSTRPSCRSPSVVSQIYRTGSSPLQIAASDHQVWSSSSRSLAEWGHHDASIAEAVSSSPAAIAVALFSRFLAAVRLFFGGAQATTGGEEDSPDVLDCWRGMRDLRVTPLFLSEGGSECAPHLTSMRRTRRTPSSPGRV